MINIDKLFRKKPIEAYKIYRKKGKLCKWQQKQFCAFIGLQSQP